ncbi:DUF488 domain-containing protein [Methylocystis bryophila]|uniref:DUF488 domain-containing protein n=1 Tax=Methylocystis bryophila TaxID=655015 RepID=A0A1W6MVI4_9HYPH|nr:hypothetical protein B1812_11100 [Methylocystis bryophila]BDV37549.1 hypothetical protein DSM21852_08020 [Methylocystis bryophila]
MTQIEIKRAYEPPDPQDGKRVLVDRLWPRGLSRDAAKIDAWIKDVAPSAELRRWFSHDPSKWREFRRRYREELAESAAFAELQQKLQSVPKTTLLFAARDVAHNNAVVLRDELAGSAAESFPSECYGAKISSRIARSCAKCRAIVPAAVEAEAGRPT